MSIVNKLEHHSVEEYLDTEELGDVRHEYVDGMIYAMVGASARHNLIAGAFFANLRSHLSASGCHVFQSDMKVNVGEVFYYPDIMVTCGPVDPASRFQTNPSLIIEVLSPTTEAKDRLEKLAAYRTIPTLKEYVIAEQTKVELEIFRRLENEWQVETCRSGDEVSLQSVGLVVPIETYYEDVLGFIG